MERFEERFEAFGLSIPRILLPSTGVDKTKWGVVACDQFTSEQGYWIDVEKTVGKAPSTFRMILPECYLDDPSAEGRIASIWATMKDYLVNGTMQDCGEGFILVKRTTDLSPPRYGLIAAVDLEQYDYSKDSSSLIRASEGTIVSRIPPRIRIRQEAELELPHIMVLIDDHEKSLIEPLVRNIRNLPLLYETDLMLRGGHLSGYAVRTPELFSGMLKTLERMASAQRKEELYGKQSDLLFAVGDGNHSLATAKAVWENLKKTGVPLNHPARFALVEIVNIYDPGLVFHPIHRILFHADYEDILNELEASGQYQIAEASRDAQQKGSSLPADSFLMVSKRSSVCVTVRDRERLTVDSLQVFLDSYVAQRRGIMIDYVHGDESALNLGRTEGNVAFILPSMEKRLFFETIVRDGVLPRKTFSIGEAREKRYYFEARKIR
jgi:hypothetical protein